MKYIISDSLYPSVEVSLDKDEQVIANSGALCWRDSSFSMDVIKNPNSDGIIKGLLFDNHFLMNKFISLANGSKIVFSSCFPGKIKSVELKSGESIICQSGSLLFALGNVSVSPFFNKKLSIGIFGGEAFFLEKIVGPGIAFIEIDGEEINRELSDGEKIVISEGHLVSISDGCLIDVQSNGGLKNALFGGEGIYITTVTGPGKVTLQSMPVQKLANNLDPYIDHPENRNN